MKALVLAGGRGKRLGEITQSKNKCMLEIHGRLLITYSLDCASKIGVSEIVIVVGYQAEDIKKAIGDKYKGIPVKYVFQAEQKGLVHAIECAKEAIGGEDFFLFLGDELMVNPKHSEMIEKFRIDKPFAITGVIRVDDPNLISKTYGIQEEEGLVRDLIEKPSAEAIRDGLVMRDIMGTGNCVFRNDIFKYIDITPINPKRGEKELPDLIKTTIKNNNTVEFVTICDGYFNVNVREEIKDVESYFIHFSEDDKHKP